MKNDVFQELCDTMEMYYAFFEDDNIRWKMLRKKYEFLKSEPIGYEFYTKTQDMLREMNDLHLSIHLRGIVGTIPDIIFTALGGSYYVVDNGKYSKVIKINDKNVDDLVCEYKMRYPLVTETFIMQMILEDFYSNRFCIDGGLVVSTSDGERITRSIEKEQFVAKNLKTQNLFSLSVNIPSDVLYIPLTSYDAFTMPALTNSSKNIIVDLRNNSGGSVRKALEIISNFAAFDIEIDEYQVISRFSIENFRIYGRAKVDLSMRTVIVLINEFTMSSAEFIIALCLITKMHAIPIGLATPGASGQRKLFTINKQIPLSITTKKYVDVNGRIIRKGIKPKYHVDISLPDIYAGVDRQFEYALQILMQKI